MPWDTRKPWTYAQVLEVAQALVRWGVFWMEEPLHRRDYAGMARLRNSNSFFPCNRLREMPGNHPSQTGVIPLTGFASAFAADNRLGVSRFSAGQQFMPEQEADKADADA